MSPFKGNMKAAFRCRSSRFTEAGLCSFNLDTLNSSTCLEATLFICTSQELSIKTRDACVSRRNVFFAFVTFECCRHFQRTRLGWCVFFSGHQNQKILLQSWLQCPLGKALQASYRLSSWTFGIFSLISEIHKVDVATTDFLLYQGSHILDLQKT